MRPAKDKAYLLQGRPFPGIADEIHHPHEAKAVVAMQVSDEDVGDGFCADAGDNSLPGSGLPTIHKQGLPGEPESYGGHIPGPSGSTCKITDVEVPW